MTDYGPLPEPDTFHRKALDDCDEEASYSAEAMEAERQRCYALGEAAERERWAAVCDANASSKRALYAKTESDDDRGAAEMAEWLAGCIRGA